MHGLQDRSKRKKQEIGGGEWSRREKQESGAGEMSREMEQWNETGEARLGIFSSSGQSDSAISS